MRGRRSKAIRLKCLECAGSPKQVTLCYQFECPLWAYRCGFSTKDRRYRERMDKARLRYAKDFEEMAQIGEDIARF